jgi:putative membrane protein
MQVLVAGLAVGAEDPRNVPDPTPPPLGTASFVPPANIDEQPLTPQSFVVRAALISMAEMEIGGLAQSRSGSAAAKQLGGQLIKDHREALARLKTIGGQSKIALPGELDPQHQALRDELARLEGPPFDAKFAAAMVNGHEKALSLFQTAAKSDKLTPALRGYAGSTLPMLQHHAQMARELRSSH